ncbi:MAG: DUF3618 domain-containing protein [Acidimicrobiia bacterium]|nr:DUF3618 domain-containing protein [Acidimicrobiia bacterium]
MGQSAEELRHDIADTRAELGSTMDAIGDRVSPGRIIERRKNRLTAGMRSVKERVMGTASDTTSSVAESAHSAADTVRAAPEAALEQTHGHPMAAGAVAFGVGFLAAAIWPPSRAETDAASRMLDKAEPVKQAVVESAKEVAGDLKESAAEAVEQVKQTATEGAQEVGATAKDAARTSQDAARDAVARTKNEASDS